MFHALPHLSTREVGSVLERAVRRIERFLKKRGLLSDSDSDADGQRRTELASHARYVRTASSDPCARARTPSEFTITRAHAVRSRSSMPGPTATRWRAATTVGPCPPRSSFAAAASRWQPATGFSAAWPPRSTSSNRDRTDGRSTRSTTTTTRALAKKASQVASDAASPSSSGCACAGVTGRTTTSTSPVSSSTGSSTSIRLVRSAGRARCPTARLSTKRLVRGLPPVGVWNRRHRPAEVLVEGLALAAPVVICWQLVAKKDSGPRGGSPATTCRWCSLRFAHLVRTEASNPARSSARVELRKKNLGRDPLFLLGLGDPPVEFSEVGGGTDQRAHRRRLRLAALGQARNPRVSR